MQESNQQKKGSDVLLKLPIISSQCPGWVCYAEKTQGKQLFTNMSMIKAAQEINGVLIKQFLRQAITFNGIKDKQQEQKYIYHVAVMPCYDKKLQALHAQMIGILQYGRKDVDLTITTGQLLEILLEKGFKPEIDSDNQKQEFPFQITQSNQLNKLLQIMEQAAGYKNLGALFGETSNGYSQFLCRQFTKPQESIEFKRVRKNNNDLQIFTVTQEMLRDEYKKTLNINDLIFCKSYSFKNLTNLSRKIKASKCQYSYIEMMACPSGCFNGGGQLKSQTRNPKQLLLDIELNLQTEKKDNKDFELNSIKQEVDYVLYTLKQRGLYQYLRTSFKETQVDPNAFTISW